MAPRGNGKDNAVGKDVYLVKVNEDAKTAEVARLPIGVENDEGETFYLVRNHVVKDLAEVAYPGDSELVRSLAEQNIRGQLSSGSDFETLLVNIDLDKMTRSKVKVKVAKADKNEDEDESEEVEEVAPQPQATEAHSYDPSRF